MRIDIHHIIAFHIVFVGCKLRMAMWVGMRVTLRVSIGIGIGMGIGVAMAMPNDQILRRSDRRVEMEMRTCGHSLAGREECLEHDGDHHSKREPAYVK